MSVIGDALGRAERDYQAGHIQKAVTPSRASRVRAPEPAETAVKGIARPQQSMTGGTSWFSSILMTVFVAVIGLAGYIAVYPEWVDSLWNFPDPNTSATSVASKSADSPVVPVAAQAAPQVASAALPIPSEPVICPQIAYAQFEPVASNQLSTTAPSSPTPQALPPVQSPFAQDAETKSSQSDAVAVPTPRQQVLPGPLVTDDTKPAITPAVVESQSVAHEPVEKQGGDRIQKPTPREKPATKHRKRPRGRRVTKRKPPEKPTRSITKVPVRTNKLAERFQVEGVMLGGERKLAVINGEIVGVDDEVDGAVVRAITGNGIAIEIDGRIRRVPVNMKNRSSVDGQSDVENELGD